MSLFPSRTAAELAARNSVLPEEAIQRAQEIIDRVGQGGEAALRALTEEFALRMPPSMLDEIAAAWPDDQAARQRWEGVIDRLLITLQFRRDMLEELRDE